VNFQVVGALLWHLDFSTMAGVYEDFGEYMSHKKEKQYEQDKKRKFNQLSYEFFRYLNR
jgi:hypothetical protein